MGKNKKRVKSQSERAGGTIPPPVNQNRNQKAARPWYIPMIIGGLSVFALFVGVPWVLGKLFPRDPSTASRTTTPSTTTPSSPATTTRQTPAPAPTSTTRAPAPVRGVVAKLPTGGASSFGNDEGLANEFAQARADLTGGKSPMVVRNSLEAMLGRTAGNPGREHILMALAYTDLRTRNAPAAANRINTLLQEFPNTSYAGLAKAMQIDAEFQQASPQQKGQAPDAQAMQAVISKANALAEADSSNDAKAYARYIVASAQELQGQTDAAIAGYLSVAERFPETHHAVLSLVRAGRAQQKAGKLEEAAVTYERMVKAYPSDEATKDANKSLRELKIIGKPAPELMVQSWASGSPTSLADLKGKVVMVNFWQTWCPHCREEMPHLSDLYNRYKDKGFVIIGATRDDKRQDQAALMDYLQQNPVPFPIARVDNQTARDYAVTGIPAAALVDKNGVVRWRAHPNSLTEAQIESYLAQK